MNDATALLRLMSWLSPVFPIGGFAYSAGLEQAVHAGHVGDRKSLAAWIEVQLTQGGQWNDAVILVEAHRCAGDRDDLLNCPAFAGRFVSARSVSTKLWGRGRRFFRPSPTGSEAITFPDGDASVRGGWRGGRT
jgi:urease accessory protein